MTNKEALKKRSPAKSVAYLGILTALAIVAGYLERFIPAPVAVPGIKLGLANVVVLTALYALGAKEALSVSVIRVMVNGLMFSGVFGVIYSLSGAILSFLAMLIGKKLNVFGVVGVSVLGGVFHNAGQIIAAAIIVENLKLLYYMPVLIVSGVIMGVITGFCAGFTLIHLIKLKIDI
ncbi:hypothetical protein FACS189490_01020 [Clostridia bacterium]|nr:hypothetical protein FACS189490_01020 [Clostridia bacterium]